MSLRPSGSPRVAAVAATAATAVTAATAAPVAGDRLSFVFARLDLTKGPFATEALGEEAKRRIREAEDAEAAELQRASKLRCAHRQKLEERFAQVTPRRVETPPPPAAVPTPSPTKQERQAIADAKAAGNEEEALRVQDDARNRAAVAKSFAQRTDTEVDDAIAAARLKIASVNPTPENVAWFLYKFEHQNGRPATIKEIKAQYKTVKSASLNAPFQKVAVFYKSTPEAAGVVRLKKAWMQAHGMPLTPTVDAIDAIDA